MTEGHAAADQEPRVPVSGALLREQMSHAVKAIAAQSANVLLHSKKASLTALSCYVVRTCVWRGLWKDPMLSAEKQV